MPWLQAHIETETAQATTVEDLFKELGALSVSMTDAGNQPILEPPLCETPLWNRTRVSGLFDLDMSSAEVVAAFTAAFGTDVATALNFEELGDRPWERAWLGDFHPMRFGSRLWVCPHGQLPDQDDAVVVQLDPGLAFGTGTHPTTALCLEWLDRAKLEGRQIIDYGCGSGILSLAALRLGAASAVAVDHDPQALRASADNAERNGVADRLQLYTQEGLPDDTRADILLANILACPLIDLAPRLAGLLRPGANIVLSGILATQADAVRESYAPFCRIEPPVNRDEWVLLQGTRR